MKSDKSISGVLSETQNLKDANIELTNTLDKLMQAQSKMAVTSEKSSRAYQDISVQLRKAENALKSNNEQIDKNTRMLDMAKGSFEKNKALLESLKAQYVDLTSSQGDNVTGASKLNNQIALLGKTVDDQGKKLEKSREVFDFHKKSIEAVEDSYKDLYSGAGDFAPVLDSVSKGFNAMKDGLDVAKTGLRSVGSALKATGFGLLVLVLESITEYFTKDKIGIKRFQGILAAVGVVVDEINGAFLSLGRSIVDALYSPGDTIKRFWTGLINTFSKSFSALGDILSGVFTLNPEKISAGVSTLRKEINKTTTTIKDGFNHLKNEMVELGGNAGKAYHEAYKNAGEKTVNTSRKILKAKAPKDVHPPHLEVLEAASGYAIKKIGEEKKLYDTELALLNDQLRKKLVSQEEYNKQSEQLQQTYHQNIGNNLDLSNEKAKAAMEARFKNIIEQQHNRDVQLKKGKMEQDEKDLNKAILPGQQMDAEKKLIADKYDYEIALAGGNTEKIKQLELDKQKSLTDVANQHEQQRKEFALNSAQQVADKAFSIIGNNIKSTSDAKLKGLETQKVGELSNTSLTATQRKAIEDKYKKKEAEEKLKAFKSEQRASLLQAIVNGALAVTKVTAQTGVIAPFVIPGIIASTALQVATILAQKPPAFAKGGHFVSDGRGTLLPGYSRTDNTNAYLRSGEAVVVSEAMRNPWARNLVSAINVAHGGRDFSVSNTGRGYAIGGIYTDGGNANRYYNQPVNDAKELANTLAYQMINNFPPIYVDVKDVNNQQNILAQTVNRVNL
ncbi:hypothetical protein [Mucilaginibacter glaciei]|uniref:Uncharacterized protein n=1 Tax=Mucilaginibacter glaciei TaxID=2772109 RepID=A0A926NV51_9SPHI|nr:hypothetical protein [Mucilaginibacter glaciei]MBD1394605.1 hypothetical protein [Mucilaginibacter glaciei]